MKIRGSKIPSKSLTLDSTQNLRDGSVELLRCFFQLSLAPQDVIYTKSQRIPAGSKMPISVQTFRQLILTHKVGQTDLVLVYDDGSLVGLCMQQYKSLCAAVTIYIALVGIQTDRRNFYQCIWIAESAEIKKMIAGSPDGPKYTVMYN